MGADIHYLPYGKPDIIAQEVSEVIEVLTSGWISQGPKILDFEEKVASYCGTKYAVAVSSGTAGLHLAAIVAGLGQGKRLWTSPITFVASANCGLYTGANVDFVDIDTKTYNMDISQLEDKLKKAQKNETLPDVLVPVHFAGLSCRMEKIFELADQYGFKIIEDACHALGGDYKDRKIGACIYSEMTVFSFHPVKSITTGEGGMILTNDINIYKRLQKLRSHGLTKDTDTLLENHGSWYYEQHELGFNYRISDLQCALGMGQMKRLDGFIAKRRYLASLYDELLKPLPVRTQVQSPDGNSARHIYVIRLNLTDIKMNKGEVFEKLREMGLGVQVHYIPVPMQPYYRNLGFSMDRFPEAKKYYEEAITLPLYPGLEDKDVHRVVDILKKIIEKDLK